MKEMASPPSFLARFRQRRVDLRRRDHGVIPVSEVHQRHVRPVMVVEARAGRAEVTWCDA
ncbi:hypothetical protein F383_00690 [Gossypium arboreum]|uniref:Uncharacterized protein n=4 Tax=Gossypium TaxID=3633 RepID=A0A0B0PMI7_GOSAR|nr:hypothetical protein ES319_A07G080000v1 [Gossypium barbadense]KHG26087.1 hypothetical protein F383_00690 [Gossypium arboreum]TYH09300.1 hypothetical protein ES288_A07G084000v1 [Gossypium darwinii]TYJ25908.1 hypothetical protein E1A91_A07G080900v1 [Gossypium mustelinum]